MLFAGRRVRPRAVSGATEVTSMSVETRIPSSAIRVQVRSVVGLYGSGDRGAARAIGVAVFGRPRTSGA